MDGVSIIAFANPSPVPLQRFRCRVPMGFGVMLVLSEMWAAEDVPQDQAASAFAVPETGGSRMVVVRYIIEETGEIFRPDPSSVDWTLGGGERWGPLILSSRLG